MKVHRVVVRGQFADLTDEQRTGLLAELDDHDIFKAAYTEWGTFTYERNLVSFSFRYEVRTPDGPDASGATEPEDGPVEIGLRRTRAHLDGWGLGHKHLRGTATDMATVWSG